MNTTQASLLPSFFLHNIFLVAFPQVNPFSSSHPNLSVVPSGAKLRLALRLRHHPFYDTIPCCSNENIGGIEGQLKMVHLGRNCQVCKSRMDPSAPESWIHGGSIVHPSWIHRGTVDLTISRRLIKLKAIWFQQ